MIILGIDPGYAILGYGVIQYEKSKFTVLSYGVVKTPATLKFPERLRIIYQALGKIIKDWNPEVLAVEELFFSRNTTTAIGTAQARGVVVLAGAEHQLAVYEYTPMQVKQAVVGYGRAEKKQVQEMSRIILNLKKIPRPDDAADALAIAICHAHTGNRREFEAVGGYQ